MPVFKSDSWLFDTINLAFGQFKKFRILQNLPARDITPILNGKLVHLFPTYFQLEQDWVNWG